MASTTKRSASDQLASILAGAEKKYPGALHKASESVPVNRLPFVEPNLNFATEGGAGFGRFMAMYGQENSGKTRVALELIAQAQRLPQSAEDTLIPRIVYHSSRADDLELSDARRARHMAMAVRLTDELEWIRTTFPDGADAIYYNAEQQFEPIWAKKIGVDLDRLLIFQSNTIEEIVEMMGSLYEHVPLHVIDSTSNASSLISQSKDVGASIYGRNALQWKTSLMDSLPSFDPARNMAIMIHQLSTNVKTGASAPVSTRYMRFIARLSLNFSHGKFLYRKDGVLEEDKPTGHDKLMAYERDADGREVWVKVDKSTICRVGRESVMHWDRRKSQFVELHDLASGGLWLGVIKKSGSWFSIEGEEKNIGQGLKSVYTRLADDEELRSRIAVQLLDYTAEPDV